MNNGVEVKGKERVRGALLHLEQLMSRCDMSVMGDDSCALEHRFEGGWYIRTIHIPKGSLIMGKIHKHQHPNHLIQGSVIMITEFGPEKLVAPVGMMSPAGIKRFLFTLEDVIWETRHETDKTDPAEAEADIIANTYEELGMNYEAVTTRYIGGAK